MDAIDKLAKSKAKYPLLGMQLKDTLIFGQTHRPYNDIDNKVINAGAWLSDMEVPKWFEDSYGQGNACSGWYIEINHGEYALLPYDIHYIEKLKQNKKIPNKNKEHNNSSKNEKDKMSP
jgi:hypothetical protein